MRGMEAQKIITHFGQQGLADKLNALDPARHFSRQRIQNWNKSNSIPAWAQIAYAGFWKKAIKKASHAESVHHLTDGETRE